MKNNLLTKSYVVVAAIVALAFPPAVSLAADDVRSEAGTDGITFVVRPYVWGLGFEGDVGAGDYRTHVDASFSDVVDTLEMGAILQLEGRSGRWGVIVDGVALKLSDEKSTPGPFFSAVPEKMEKDGGGVRRGQSRAGTGQRPSGNKRERCSKLS